MPVPTMLRGVDTTDLRKHCDRRMVGLDLSRMPWIEFCRSVAEQILPSRLPYLADPHSNSRAGEQNSSIVDAVGHLSLDTTSAYVHSGLMPPTAEWFGLSIRAEMGDGDEQDEGDDQRIYLAESARRMRDRHNQSNANNAFPECQKEWVAFGTGTALVLADDEDSHRVEHLSVGEYWIAEDHKGRVDTLYRKLTMTVGQLADEFGTDTLSPNTLAEFDKGNYDTVIPCVHAIEPDRDKLNPHGRNLDQPWRSVYYEAASDCKQVLAVRGYSYFPALVWRWNKLPGTAYGLGRGHDCLPHLVRLRSLIYRYGQALAQQVQPSLQGPPGLTQRELKGKPGGYTTVFGQQAITPLYQVQVKLAELGVEIESARKDIRDTLGASLVASLRRIDHQMTAHEVSVRTQQDLTEWLPGLYRQGDEMVSRYVEMLWGFALERGELPEEPAILQGKLIDIEHKSPLARKQEQTEADAIVRTFAVATELAKSREDVLDVLNPDEAIRRIAKIEGAHPKVLLSIDAVRKIRAAKAEAQQAEAQAAAAQQSADIAATAAKAQVA